MEDSAPEALSCLGIVPHTIRGFLGRYSTVLPTGEAFSQCVACSPTVRMNSCFTLYSIGTRGNDLGASRFSEGRVRLSLEGLQ